MVVDADTKYYHKAYKLAAYKLYANACEELNAKQKEIDEIVEKLKEHKRLCERNEIYIDDLLALSYSDFIKTFDKTKYIRYISNQRFNEVKPDVLNIIKYAALVKEYLYIETKKKAYNDSKTINYYVFSKYVQKFYINGVHKCLLDGYAYKWKDGLGMIIIGKWKMDKNAIDKSDKIYVDFNETNKKKREILARGGKLYDKEEEEQAIIKGIPYDGEKYIVYKKIYDRFDISVTNNNRLKDKSIRLKYHNYVPTNLRCLTQAELAARCKTKEDVYNLKCSLFFKLGIYNIFDPTAYLKYIRNEEQYKYAYGTHCSKNRKRFQS